MNNFFTGMLPSDYLYLGSFLVGGAVIVWLALSRRAERRWQTHRLKSERHQTEYWNGVAIHFDNKFKEAASALAEKDRVIETQKGALIEKNKLIDEILRDSNNEIIRIEGIHRGNLQIEAKLRAQIEVLHGILIRKLPATRTMINDPAKLSAWLERLKGKKAGRKSRPLKIDITGKTLEEIEKFGL